MNSSTVYNRSISNHGTHGSAFKMMGTGANKPKYGSIDSRKRVYDSFRSPAVYSERHVDRSEKKKKTWNEEEDEQLRELVMTLHDGSKNKAIKWTVIAEKMTNRSGKQCRERWHNHLRPDLKKGEWTKEEDALIVKLQARMGNQWSKITSHLPGRTDNDVKNRWHSSMRAKRREQASLQSTSRNDEKETKVPSCIYVEDMNSKGAKSPKPDLTLSEDTEPPRYKSERKPLADITSSQNNTPNKRIKLGEDQYSVTPKRPIPVRANAMRKEIYPAREIVPIQTRSASHAFDESRDDHDTYSPAYHVDVDNFTPLNYLSPPRIPNSALCEWFQHIEDGPTLGVVNDEENLKVLSPAGVGFLLANKATSIAHV